jgi:hypothetical protein
MVRAKGLGFQGKGYGTITSLFAAVMGVRLSSKVKKRIVYPGSFYRLISQR